MPSYVVGSFTALIGDRALHDRIADAAMAIATSRYCVNSIVPLYEDYYRQILEGRNG